MQSYFRRSRSGCITCRAIRIKCDERHPTCLRCEERGVGCGGYPKKLKWVAQAISLPSPGSAGPSPLATTHPINEVLLDGQSSLVKLKPPSVQRQLTLSSLSLANVNDNTVFNYWITILPELVYLDPNASFDLRSMYMSLVHEPNSALLPAILANAASHMSALGMLSQDIVLSMNQRALRGMVYSLSTLSGSKRFKGTITDKNGTHRVPTAISDQTIAASLMLAGNEVMQGSDLARIIPLIRGTTSLVEERYHYFHCSCPQSHPGWTDASLQLDTLLFQLTTKTLAYFDILSCVPCARIPILNKKHWFHEGLCMFDNNNNQLRPDISLGYCANIFAILGESATLVELLYNRQVNKDAFTHTQTALVERLDKARSELPSLRKHSTQEDSILTSSEYVTTKTHNACVHAAIAHTFATQIFILRVTDTLERSSRITMLTDQLYEAIRVIPLDTTAVAILLWPLWVLGCESYARTPRQKEVRELFQSTFERQHILNVSTTLNTLEERIWSNHGSVVSPESEPSSPNEDRETHQSSWVRRCWQERIELILA